MNSQIFTEKLQGIMEEMKEISHMDYFLFSEEGDLEAQTKDVDIPELGKMVRKFRDSPAERQIARGFFFVRICIWGRTEYILLAETEGTDEHSYTIVQMAASQIRNLYLMANSPMDENQYLRQLLLGNLSDEEMKQTETFVSVGGTVIAAGQTGMINSPSAERERFLKSLGIRRVKEFRTDMISACFKIEEGEKEIFSSFRDCDVVALGDRYQYLETEDTAETLLSMIPVHTYGPPECCYHTEITEAPACVISSLGKGRAVTIPWFPGEFYSRTGFDNLSLFMRDILVNLGGCESIAPDLSPMVEVTYSEHGADYDMIQLVNTSGCFGLSFYEPIPVREVEITLPCQGPPVQVFALAGGRTEWRMEEGRIRIQLDILRDYEAILIRKQTQMPF